MTSHQRVLILDFGSQYTQLIARRIREQRVYCEIKQCTEARQGCSLSALLDPAPDAIILSGGPSSIYEDGAPSLDPRILQRGIPILGICYGLQVMAHVLGGRVEPADKREYGTAKIGVVHNTSVFSRFQVGDNLDVWMSHGDRIAQLPSGFEILGMSDNTPYAAVANRAKRLYGVQFHPEVAHTPRGADIISAFLFDIAKLQPTWTPNSFIESSIVSIREQVGKSRLICGLSGGVDSSTAALLCHRAVGDALTCVLVDNGLMRTGEVEQIQNLFHEHFGVKLITVDARNKFMAALVGVTEPEKKRKIIGRTFIDVFEEEANREKTDFLVQGTIYPDVIESISVHGPSSSIKSHHNVGGLPERMHLKLVEPLRELFKDEVRLVANALQMPPDFIQRQPFPGPGLAIRCLGEVTPARLSVLRQADLILDGEIRNANLYESLWQAFCVLLPVRSVGVMGDMRTYDEVCAIRAVHSTDGMTADWAHLPFELLSRLSTRIVNEVQGINRVVYDISSKPPSTIEWE